MMLAWVKGMSPLLVDSTFLPASMDFGSTSLMYSICAPYISFIAVSIGFASGGGIGPLLALTTMILPLVPFSFMRWAIRQARS